MKYKITTRSNDLYPFKISRKDEKSFWPFWRSITTAKSIHEAESFVKRAVERHAKAPIGSVVFEYDESDLVVDTLKNQRMMNEDRVAMQAEGRPQMAVGQISNSAHI